MTETISEVNERFDCVLKTTGYRLKSANTKRGDSWRDIGAIGLFLEVRTMYLRLRDMVWNELTDKERPLGEFGSEDPDDIIEHRKRVFDCLTDLRAYTVLLELAVRDENYFGTGDDTQLEGGGDSIEGKNYPLR
jgi:hypothetical protein